MNVQGHSRRMLCYMATNKKANECRTSDSELACDEHKVCKSNGDCTKQKS